MDAIPTYWLYVAVSTPAGFAAVAYVIGSGLVLGRGLRSRFWGQKSLAFALGAVFGGFKTLALAEAVGAELPWPIPLAAALLIGFAAIPQIYLVQTASRLNRSAASSHTEGDLSHDRNTRQHRRSLRPGDWRQGHDRPLRPGSEGRAA